MVHIPLSTVLKHLAYTPWSTMRLALKRRKAAERTALRILRSTSTHLPHRGMLVETPAVTRSVRRKSVSGNAHRTRLQQTRFSLTSVQYWLTPPRTRCSRRLLLLLRLVNWSSRSTGMCHWHFVTTSATTNSTKAVKSSHRFRLVRSEKWGLLTLLHKTAPPFTP